jgi:hypothetical protein
MAEWVWAVDQNLALKQVVLVELLQEIGTYYLGFRTNGQNMWSTVNRKPVAFVRTNSSHALHFHTRCCIYMYSPFVCNIFDARVYKRMIYSLWTGACSWSIGNISFAVTLECMPSQTSQHFKEEFIALLENAVLLLYRVDVTLKNLTVFTSYMYSFTG